MRARRAPRLSGPVLLAVIALAAPVRAGEADLAAAQRAMRELRYADARASVAAALRVGGHARLETLELYALAGEVAAILDGADGGEREFRRLLELDPQHAPPRRATPVFLVPFERARRWVETNGRLTVEHAAPVALDGRATSLTIRITSDPLELIASARCLSRVGAEGMFTKLPGDARAVAPPARAGETIEYFFELLDGADNVLAELGSAEDPLRVAVSALPGAPLRPPALPLVATSASAPPGLNAQATRPHLLRYAIGSGAAAAVLLAAGITFDVSSQSEFDSLQRRCAPRCTANDLSTLHTEEGLAAASYVLAGGAAVVAGVLILVDRLR